MRWVRIRKAHIDSKLRETFEQHGVGTMQQFLVSPDRDFLHQTRTINTYQCRTDLLAWLTEQYDLAERKETWNLTMEAAIVVLIVVELAIMLLSKK